MLKEIVIIGGGPAGNAAALGAADAGASSIVLIESDALGGTCTNRGCIPTKFLLSRSESLGAGGSAAPAADWERLVSHKTALVRGLSRSIESRCLSRGIEVVHGRAHFVSPHEVEIRGSAGEVTRVEGRTFIVATGSEPAQLSAAPADGVRIITSTEALDLVRIPPSLAVIGSGAVGAEFAFIFMRLGVKVTLIEAADRLFPLEDPDVDAAFRRIYERLGVQLHVGDPVVGIENHDEGVAVQLGTGAVVESSMALVAIGRSLASTGLGCESAGIAIGDRGQILVGDRLETSQPHIFAAGDITGRMLLAHVASFMGEQAALRACGRESRTVPYHSIPWATFTAPEVGSVGLTLAAAERSGLKAVAASVPLVESVKARIDRSTEGFVKTVAEVGTGRILGGTVVGRHASELVHIFALAIHNGMTVSDMRGFAFAHPSVSELFGELFVMINIT